MSFVVTEGLGADVEYLLTGGYGDFIGEVAPVRPWLVTEGFRADPAYLLTGGYGNFSSGDDSFRPWFAQANVSVGL